MKKCSHPLDFLTPLSDDQDWCCICGSVRNLSGNGKWEEPRVYTTIRKLFKKVND